MPNKRVRTMSGSINVVQVKILAAVPSAYFVHCNAHNLSLAFQDGVSELPSCRDALHLVKDIVTSLRELPKRMAFHKSSGEDVTWTAPIMPNEMDNVHFQCECVTCYMQLLHFRMFFTLRCLNFVFGHLETTAKAIQSPNLSMGDVFDLMSTVIFVLEQLRTDDKFNNFWEEVTQTSEIHNIDPPELPRKRKRLRFYDDDTNDYEFQDVKSYYRKQYFEVVDVSLTTLKSRFSSPSFQAVMKLECNTLRAATVRDTANVDVNHICDT